MPWALVATVWLGPEPQSQAGHFLSKSHHDLPCGSHVPSWDTGVEEEGLE